MKPDSSLRYIDLALPARRFDHQGASMKVQPLGAVVAMTAAGVTVLIDAAGPGLPVIAYWGPELPGLDAEQAAALLRASRPVPGTNTISVPPRVAVLPEHHGGWVGRP